MRFGLQLYPPKRAPEMAEYAQRALAQYAFDTVWVPDHLTYENVFVTLAAIIARTGTHVGSSVIHPFSRTPLDLASSFAALSHMAGARGVTVGLGAGSSSSDMIRKRHRVGMARETTLFLRAAFAGERFSLGEFPTLCDFFRLDPGAQGFLRLPPTTAPEIFIAAAGPRMLKLAGELGDGLIVSNLSFPTAAVRLGALEPALRAVDAARRPENRGAPFTKVLHLHVSVSRHGAQAKRFARRMAAGAVIQGHILKQRLVILPVPDQTAARIRSAHSEGKNIDEMIDLISDDLLAECGAVIAGSPAECISGLDEMIRAAQPYGFDLIDIASPLGPDWDEAIDLICQEIVPELQRRHGGV